MVHHFVSFGGEAVSRLSETDSQAKGAAQASSHVEFPGRALKEQNFQVHIIHIAAEMTPVSKVWDAAIESYFDGRLYKNKFWVGIVEGLPVYLIEFQHPANFSGGDQFCRVNDDFNRFSHFSRVALELLFQAGKRPDLIHCHDWQTTFVELANIKETDESISALEDELSSLEAILKNLESRLLTAEHDVSKISTLKLECRDLGPKVENLQELLDKATKQADKAISVLQQNSQLRKKVDRLGESFEEAKLSRISSEKMEQYSELMQQKISILEERPIKSDDEILTHVQLYQEYFKEFRDILEILKEQSMGKALDEPVDEMSWEFWSRLLLMIDGWFLEKKISSDDAKLLGEMTWKRDNHICNAYLASKTKSEPEMLATFLNLISSPTSSRLHIIHIAAELAPVAKVGGLGDVVSGLGKALQKKGHLVEIIIPKYDCMQYDRVSELRGGCGLRRTLNSHSKKFIGVLNGIDTDAWDPTTDDFLKVQFNADDLQGKLENKEYLRKYLKLSPADPMQPLEQYIELSQDSVAPRDSVAQAGEAKHG